jgi:hypothetical protein
LLKKVETSRVIKIIVGALLLLAGIRNCLDVFMLPNPKQAAFFMVTTLFFLMLGGWLLYSGIRKKPEPTKIYDDSEDSN